VEPEEPEEEDNSLTFEEYQAQKAAARPAGEAFATLKPREVESDFGDAAKISKDDQEDYFGGKSKSLRKKNKGNKKAENILTDYTIAPSADSGGGGKGKGKGKGSRDGGFRASSGKGKGGSKGKGKGKGKGSRGGARGLNVNDSSAFPTLG
jgi:plasminogen activator inhibitor 1 RNA-binding protein